MKFTASILAVLAITTGAFASPAPRNGPPGPPGPPPPPPPPPPPSPPKAPKPVKQTNNCGNDQSLFCCSTSEESSSISCVSFTNGGIGGICNGIQLCCNNNGSGSQSCGLNTGGGTITFSPSIGGGHGPWI